MDCSLTIVKKDVQCSLCNETLIEPKILACFHTFCKLCIKRNAELIEEVNVFSCPECKSQTSLTQLNSLEDLKPSLLHLRMIKVLEFVENEKVCSDCESHSPASWHCFDCNRSLCDECEKSHSVFNKSDKVVSLVNTTEEDIKLMLSRETDCEHHVDRAVGFFCRDCEQIICIECLKNDHDEHSTVTLAKHSSAQRAKLCEQLEILKKREQILVKKFEDMKELDEKFKQSCEKAKGEVKEKSEKCIKLLEEKARNLVKEIDENIETAEQKKGIGQSVLDQVRGAIEYTNKLLDKGIVNAVIYMKNLEDVGKDTDIYDPIEEENQDFGMKFVPNDDLMKEVQSGLGTLKEINKTDNTKTSDKVAGELEAFKEMKLNVFINSKKNAPSYNAGDFVEVKIIPEEDVIIIEKKYVKSAGKLKIKIKIMAKVAGPLEAEIKMNGKHVSNSPLVLNVKPQQLRRTREFNMKGVKVSSISGITVNNDNSRIAVSDDYYDCVHVFSSDGYLLLTYDKLGCPEGLSFLNKTDLVIAEFNSHRICIVDTITGRLVKTIGNQGNKEGEFSLPRGVHVDDDGNIIVCDHGNHRVQVFTRDGAYQYQFGLPGQVNFSPVSAVTHGERFYVSDYHNDVIHVFEKKDGVPSRVSTIGIPSSVDGQLSEPCGLAVDSNHHLIVCDFGNHCVKKFTVDGRLVGKTCETIDDPRYVSVLNDGQLMVAYYKSGVYFIQ